MAARVVVAALVLFGDACGAAAEWPDYAITETARDAGSDDE